jgi:hypothetical protein
LLFVSWQKFTDVSVMLSSSVITTMRKPHQPTKRSDDRGRMHVGRIGKLLEEYTALQPRRQTDIFTFAAVRTSNFI